MRAPSAVSEIYEREKENLVCSGSVTKGGILSNWQSLFSIAGDRAAVSRSDESIAACSKDRDI
jgi:hypothetical protein